MRGDLAGFADRSARRPSKAGAVYQACRLRPRLRSATVAAQTDAMRNDLTIIERAYELARSGEGKTIDGLASRLNKEGYERVDAHLQSKVLRVELQKLFVAARLASEET